MILSKEEKDEILQQYPQAKLYIKEFMGASDFLRGFQRWCLWVEDKQLDDAKKIDLIAKRLEKVTSFRLKSDAECTVEYAKFPNRFKQITYRPSESIIVPSVSSERREYIPFGFL